MGAVNGTVEVLTVWFRLDKTLPPEFKYPYTMRAAIGATIFAAFSLTFFSHLVRLLRKNGYQLRVFFCSLNLCFG